MDPAFFLRVFFPAPDPAGRSGGSSVIQAHDGGSPTCAAPSPHARAAPRPSPPLCARQRCAIDTLPPPTRWRGSGRCSRWPTRKTSPSLYRRSLGRCRNNFGQNKGFAGGARPSRHERRLGGHRPTGRADGGALQRSDGGGVVGVEVGGGPRAHNNFGCRRIAPGAVSAPPTPGQCS